ncbi:MAG: hypothetical protein JWQ76_466 [Ramlibacter sp.]|nr:hypothetical protein [Ramlibacter sp.]
MLGADMRYPFPVLPGLRPAVLATACIGLLSAAAHAQTLPGGVQLGMTLQQLQQAVPALTPVAHPAHLAGGLVGRWSGPAIQLAGVALTPTFFFADAHLQRVEYLASSGDGAAAFDSLLAWGRAAWGPELASQNPEGAYATWASGEVDAYLQQASAAQGPRVRLVIKRRLVKDGSDL